MQNGYGTRDILLAFSGRTITVTHLVINCSLHRFKHMGRKVWIEAAINGAWTRAKQPMIPLSPEEIIEEAVACGREGASIVHYHAYDPATGQQVGSVDVNKRIIEAIKSQVDMIVYPSVSPITPTQALSLEAGPLRYATLKELGECGLMEWMVVDPGSCNMYSVLPEQDRSGPQGVVYINHEGSLTTAMELARDRNIRPSYAIYEPGFIRWGSVLAKRFKTLTPIYRLMFSDQFTFGPPVEQFALEAYVKMLSHEVPGAPWMIAGLGVNIMPLVPATVALGGHVRVGLEDGHLGTQIPNWKSVRDARDAIVASGGDVASAADVRAALANG